VRQTGNRVLTRRTAAYCQSTQLRSRRGEIRRSAPIHPLVVPIDANPHQRDALPHQRPAKRCNKSSAPSVGLSLRSSNEIGWNTSIQRTDKTWLASTESVANIGRKPSLARSTLSIRSFRSLGMATMFSDEPECGSQSPCVT